VLTGPGAAAIGGLTELLLIFLGVDRR